MSVIRATQLYIEKALKAVDGMKVLLMDAETTGMVSVVFSQSEILQKEVYLFEKITQKGRQLLGHLKAVCFLRPTRANVELLAQELKDPKYGEYHVFFTNTVPASLLETLAAADEHEVIQQVQEFYADYYAINADLFTLNVPRVISPAQENFRTSLARMADGVCAVMLSLRKRPTVRFSAGSEMCAKLVGEIDRRVTADRGLYHFGGKADSQPLLLVLDRKDDAVTPLLTQWTYQAMVHEFLGLDNNRVDLSHVKGIKPEMRQVVLSTNQDPFFKANAFANFGELGDNIKQLVDTYQAKTKSNQTIESIEDIKRFVEEFPEFQKMAGNVSKHVALMSELNRHIAEGQLLVVSELEQNIANNYDFSGHLKSLKALLEEPRMSGEALLRVCVLFCLRYESQVASSGTVAGLREPLERMGVPRSRLALLESITRHCGVAKRTKVDLFDDKGAKKYFKSITRGVKDVQNVYTEHEPLLKKLLANAMAGRLPEDTYPYADVGGISADRAAPPPRDIIVFMVGGATYEEALTVHEFNIQHKRSAAGDAGAGAGAAAAAAGGAAPKERVNIVLGGTTLHNSQSFLQDIASLDELM